MFKWWLAPVLLVVSVLLWYRPFAPTLVSQDESSTPAPMTATAFSTSPSFPVPDVSQLPAHLADTSLKGTTVDGQYPVDENGQLLLSADIKHRFEYFLSTLGEFELSQVLAMVRDDIAANLVSPAREQALALFEDYIAYKYALTQLEQNLEAAQSYEINDIERLRYQMQQLRDKQKEFLDPAVVDAFFGFDAIYDDYMLSKLSILNNPQLTDEQKQQQLQALRQTLPPQVQDIQRDSERISEVFKQTQIMMQQGEEPSSIYQVRSEAFGEQAARRLWTLDQERVQWHGRVETYLTQKSIIEQQAELTAEEKQHKLETLVSEQFNEQERLRLPAYEVMLQSESN